MKNNLTRFLKQKAHLLLAIAFTALLLSPLVSTQPVSAAKLITRSFSLSSNESAATPVTYTFGMTTSATTGGIEMAFCTTPLPGTTCTAPTSFSVTGVAVTGPSGFVLGTDASCVLGTSGTCNAPRCSVANTVTTPLSTNTIASSGNTACGVRIHHPSTAAGSGSTTVTLTGLTNPTYATATTFFVRIATYAGINNTYTTFQDSGTVAQSINPLQTVSFKVQETLSFCVGGMDNAVVTYAGFTAASLTNACAQSTSSSVSLGIAPNATTVCLSPASVRTATCADSSTTTDDFYPYAMLSTNASSSTVGYRINNTGGNFSQGTLQVSGASGCTFTTRTDNCIDPVNQDQAQSNGAPAGFATTSSNEEFGFAVAGFNTVGRASTLLTGTSGATGYRFTGNASGGTACTNGSGGAAAQDCFNWKTTGDTIATASGAVDNEAILLSFGVKPAVTTPAGSYSVDVDYYSVPTY